MKKPIYDRVKNILEESEPSRNNDRLLMIHVWEEESPQLFEYFNGVPYMKSSYFALGSLTTTSTIKRARRRVQSDFPELKATSEKVKKLRGQKEKTKGDFIFNNVWK